MGEGRNDCTAWTSSTKGHFFFFLQLLESSKLRLEMLLEQQRKEARLEAAARDDEMEETRANAAKKLKSKYSTIQVIILMMIPTDFIRFGD